jgi:hypothetical protein
VLPAPLAAYLISRYTVPKAFLIHEQFPVIAGKISSSKWKIKIVKNFQLLLEHFPEITGNFSQS